MVLTTDGFFEKESYDMGGILIVGIIKSIWLELTVMWDAKWRDENFKNVDSKYLKGTHFMEDLCLYGRRVLGFVLEK
jgi:hypothetical protein